MGSFSVPPNINNRISNSYQVLQDVKRQLRRDRRDAGLDGVKNESLTTGNFAISLLLQGFGVYSEEDFNRLHPQHRKYVMIHIAIPTRWLCPLWLVQLH